MGLSFQNYNLQLFTLHLFHAQTVDTHIDMSTLAAAETHLDALYKVGSFRREKAITLFTKILTKIITNPKEKKYQDLNHEKISAKFIQFQCKFMIDLLVLSGFTIDAGRLVLTEENNQIEAMLRTLNAKAQSEEDKLAQQKLQVIEQNKQRLANKVCPKQKASREKILSQHKEQMNQAKNGVYNVKACVSDRKGKGGAINGLF